MGNDTETRILLSQLNLLVIHYNVLAIAAFEQALLEV